MLPILHIGPLAIQTSGLIFVLGLSLGLSLAERQAARFHIDGKVLYYVAFTSLVAGVIGGRLAYVLHYSAAFAANPASLISLNLSMFEPNWGILLGLFAAVLIGWRKRIPLLSTLDASISALAVIAVAIHLAQFASGDAYGTPSDLPWAIDLWGIHRHPVQIYETLASLSILWLIWPRPGWFGIAGQRFLVFIATSAGARLFLEAFRGDSPLWAGFRSPQVIAWLILAACLWAYRKLEVLHGK